MTTTEPETITPNLDTHVHRFGDRLLGCLCEQLDETMFGPACRCCLVPGDEVVQDFCCDCGAGNGQAAVRVSQIYPTSQFPDPFVQGGPCDNLEWAVVFELVVDRCVETIQDNGEPPTCSTLTWQANAQMDDMAAIRRTLMCCIGDDGDPCNGGSFIPGAILPVGPSGNCLRTTGTVTVRFTDCCRNDEESPSI